MKQTIFLLFIILPTILLAQKRISFEIEKLDPPKELLLKESDKEIFSKLILQDANLTKEVAKGNNFEPLKKIVATYKAPQNFVNFGFHSFFDGMYHAYAEHRPFVISPDMVWLLISQGFAEHVNNNAELLRQHFVKHSGKLTLLVRNDSIDLNNPNSPWESLFPMFADSIANHVGKELVDNLTSNFSTTTQTTKIASQITVMNAMKKYFNYVAMRIGCGIPNVTLEGSYKDWELVLKKARFLKKYELGWWIDEIAPLLQQFVNASKNRIDKDFWRNMFKYHKNGIYDSKAIDGWFIKFFPYDKNGHRNNLDSLSGSWNLPDEIFKTDLLYMLVNPDGTITEVPLELWAGFIGLVQNEKNFALRPEIGWLVKIKDSINKAVLQDFQSKAEGEINIRVNEIPEEIFEIPYIKNLKIQFTGKIIVPDKIKKVKIDNLHLRGQIDKNEAERIYKLLPNTNVSINSGLIF
ncbi:MAG: DUF4419 domain-containing protein [Niabella sp.]